MVKLRSLTASITCISQEDDFDDERKEFEPSSKHADCKPFSPFRQQSETHLDCKDEDMPLDASQKEIRPS
jgi:hypothetical protein